MNRFDYRVPRSASLGKARRAGRERRDRRRRALRMQRRPALPDRHAAICCRRQPGGGQERRAAQCAHPGTADRRLPAPGDTVDLVLVAVNQSPDITDKLVGITTDIGKVTVTGDPTLHASGVLFVGTQNGQPKKADDARRDRRHGQGHHRAEQADHQRPELRLHLQLREGRQRQPSRCRSRRRKARHR